MLIVYLLLQHPICLLFLLSISISISITSIGIGITGINIGKPLDKSICPWYDGKPLLQVLNDMPPPEQLLQYPVRMPIVDKFADMGTIVLGKLQSGLIKKGAKLIICPIDMKCTVMDIEKHGEPAEFCEPGDNVKIKLTGIEDAEQIESGFMLCPEKFPIPYTTVFDAEVTAPILLCFLTLAVSVCLISCRRVPAEHLSVCVVWHRS